MANFSDFLHISWIVASQGFCGKQKEKLLNDIRTMKGTKFK